MYLDLKCDFCSKDIKRKATKTNNHFCDNNCKGQWQIKQRELLGYTKEWLIDQYFNQNKNCNEIGKEIGRNGKSVWGWFKLYEIKINKRGANWRNNLAYDGSFWEGRKHKNESKDKIRQARINEGSKPVLKDGKHWLHHEGAIHPNWKGGISPERQGVYSSKEWVECVKAIWKRDNATCQICKHHQSNFRETKFHIHHIESFMIREKRMDIDNLVLLCPTCHRFVHSKENINQIFIVTIYLLTLDKK